MPIDKSKKLISGLQSNYADESRQYPQIKEYLGYKRPGIGEQARKLNKLEAALRREVGADRYVAGYSAAIDRARDKVQTRRVRPDQPSVTGLATGPDTRLAADLTEAHATVVRRGLGHDPRDPGLYRERHLYPHERGYYDRQLPLLAASLRPGDDVSHVRGPNPHLPYDPRGFFDGLDAEQRRHAYRAGRAPIAETDYSRSTVDASTVTNPGHQPGSILVRPSGPVSYERRHSPPIVSRRRRLI